MHRGRVLHYGKGLAQNQSVWQQLAALHEVVAEDMLDALLARRAPAASDRYRLAHQRSARRCSICRLFGRASRSERRCIRQRRDDLPPLALASEGLPPDASDG
jgi:hypothetical protein